MSNNKIPKGKTGRLYVISAASGTGKSTIIRKVLSAIPDCVLSVSYTTRRRRPRERHGRDYFYVTEAQFRSMVRRRSFLESARVHGRSYGTAQKQVRDALARGKDVFLDIDVQGAMQIRRRFKGPATFIFLLPPSWKILSGRLRKRGTESTSEVKLRMRNARREIAHLTAYDFLLVNDDLPACFKALQEIIRSQRYRRERVLTSDRRVRRLLAGT